MVSTDPEIMLFFSIELTGFSSNQWMDESEEVEGDKKNDWFDLGTVKYHTYVMDAIKSDSCCL